MRTDAHRNGVGRQPKRFAHGGLLQIQGAIGADRIHRNPRLVEQARSGGRQGGVLERAEQQRQRVLELPGIVERCSGSEPLRALS